MLLYSCLALWRSAVCLQVIWSTSPSWSRGACWRCWSTSTSGPAKKLSASLTSCSPCWSSSQRREPRPQSACVTPGSPSSGDLQPLHLPPPPLPPPLSLSPETATDHFPVWAYQTNIYFSLFFFVSLFWISYVLVLELMLLCTFALYLFLSGVMTSGIQWIILLCGHVGSDLLCSVHQPSKPVLVLLVTHPCLLHSCTKNPNKSRICSLSWSFFCPL